MFAAVYDNFIAPIPHIHFCGIRNKNSLRKESLWKECQTLFSCHTSGLSREEGLMMRKAIYRSKYVQDSLSQELRTLISRSVGCHLSGARATISRNDYLPPAVIKLLANHYKNIYMKGYNKRSRKLSVTDERTSHPGTAIRGTVMHDITGRAI